MNLNFKQFGQGNPVLILHGLFGTLDNWQTLAKKLADNHTVFIIDQRNHGRSPHDDTFDYPTMAADLKEFMEQNWIYKAHLIGHSMGGKTVMQFALDYPDMVNKLVVVDIAPVDYPERHNHIFDALLNLHPEKIDNRKEIDAILEKQIPEYGERQFLMKNLTRNQEGGGYRFKMNLPIIYKNYAHILANVQSDDEYDEPVLFIKGGNSKHIQDEYQPQILEKFPEATVKTIENAGHWVHADQPDALLAMVREWFL